MQESGMEEPSGFADRVMGGLIVAILAYGYLWLDEKIELFVFQIFKVYEWDLTAGLRLLFAGVAGVVFMIFGSRITGWVTDQLW